MWNNLCFVIFFICYSPEMIFNDRVAEFVIDPRPPCPSVANFSLPTMDLGWFDEIKYTEVQEEEALKLVEDYNTKGKKALPPPAKKRPNNDYRSDNRRRGE